MKTYDLLMETTFQKMTLQAMIPASVSRRTFIIKPSHCWWKGHASLIQANSQSDDGLDSQLLCKVPPFRIHITCRKDNTIISSIETYKRKRAQSACDNTEGNAAPSRLRSSVLSFDIKYDCFYCTNNAQSNSKLPKGRQNKSSDVATIEYLCNVLEKCDERNDAWSNEVKLHIQNVGDSVAAEAKYHLKCGQLFTLGRQLQWKWWLPRADRTANEFSEGFGLWTTLPPYWHKWRVPVFIYWTVWIISRVSWGRRWIQ